MRILLVEDDKIIGDGINEGLSLDNHALDWVETKRAASAALASNNYDFLVLDLGLPDGSGLDVLKELRKKGNDIPVLILTAYDTIQDKIRGLDGGADDYLIKPFDLDELRVRIRALSRRANGRSSPTFLIGDVMLDPAKQLVERAGTPVKLGPKEFAILQVLMEKPGRVLSKHQIEDSLYGWDMEIESNAIEVHIHGIRKKLGKHYIETIRHVGYKISDAAGI